MDNIVYMSQRASGSTFANLARAVETAANESRTLRVMSGTDSYGPFLKFKIGEGMWSPPLYGDSDPYADNTGAVHVSAPEQDENDSLGPCGCTDYHMADCPTRTGYAEMMDPSGYDDDYYSERY